MLPMPDEPHPFLQIYFMDGEDTESALANRVDVRRGYYSYNLNSHIVPGASSASWTYYEHNVLLRFFKSRMHELQTDKHAIVINIIPIFLGSRPYA